MLPEPVEVLVVTPLGDVIKIVGAGQKTGQVHQRVLRLDQLQLLDATPEREPFDSIAIEYRWAEGHYDRLPGMAADLVRKPVAALCAAYYPAALAAKAATTNIPVVFVVGSDPIDGGLVATLNRPGGNLTGVSQFTNALIAKRLELLRELVPGTALIGVMPAPLSL